MGWRSENISGVALFRRRMLALHGALIPIPYRPLLMTAKLIMINTWT